METRLNTGQALDFTEILPIDMLLIIYAYITPEILVVMMLINKKSLAATLNTQLWKNKNTIHFPFSFEQQTNIHPYKLFQKHYKENYKTNGKHFSLVKEADLFSPNFNHIKIDDLDIQDKNGTTLLQWIIKSKRQFMLDAFFAMVEKKYLIEPNNTNNMAGKYDLSRTDKLLRTIFNWALILNQTQIVKEFIDNPDCQITKNFERKEIHLTCEYGHLEIVKLLLEKNPDLINEVDIHRNSPLIIAASRGHHHIVSYLLSKNADVTITTFNQDSYGDGFNALTWACDGGHLEVVKILISFNQLHIAADVLGSQPIHIACREGHLAITQFLLEKCPESVDAPNATHQTPLHLASCNARLAIVKYLLLKGASPFAMNIDGKKPDEITPNNVIKNLLRLEIFIRNYEKEENNYKNSLNLFSAGTKNFNPRTLEAAKALKAIMVTDGDKDLLKSYSVEFNSSDELASIYVNLINNATQPIGIHYQRIYNW